MKVFVPLFLHLASPLLAYRDGARENSCFDHAIIHDGAETFPCVPASCPFFLRIREVVDEDTLELGNETVSAYQCEELYGIELANSLNDPEGFLVQARSGTDPSSKILGEFLDPAVVQMRNPAVPLNYKVLNCNESILNTSPLPNSATHPSTVDMAGVLQLYWRAPNCSTCGLGDLRIWFTAVQQLQIVFETSKTTILRLQNYTEPLECSLTPTTMSTTTTSTSTIGSIILLPEASQACIATTTITAILCSLFFFVAGAISGGLCVLRKTNSYYQQRKVKGDHQLPSDPVYEEMPCGKSTAPKMMSPTSLTEASESRIEMETNAAYGDCRGQIN